MIQVSNVTKDYAGFRALEGVSFEIGQGEIVGLLGPNGAGKTTLLKILSGFFEPTQGSVTIDGIDVGHDPVAAQCLLGYLPENAPVYPEMLVQEYLSMLADLRKLSGKQKRDSLFRAIQAIGLAEVLTKPIGQLSKGYRQRVGLAQAILHRPKILILDEPTSGLDPTQIVEVRKLVLALARETTVILSTHILWEVEQTCQRVLMLFHGQLKADARMKDLTQLENCLLVGFGEDPGKEKEIQAELLGCDGVNSVEREFDQLPGLVFQVMGAPGIDLGNLIYGCSVAKGYSLRQLTPRTRNLEAVFRELSLGKEQAL